MTCIIKDHGHRFPTEAADANYAVEDACPGMKAAQTSIQRSCADIEFKVDPTRRFVYVGNCEGSLFEAMKYCPFCGEEFEVPD